MDSQRIVAAAPFSYLFRSIQKAGIRKADYRTQKQLC